MRVSEWKSIIVPLIDGLDAQLCPSAPRKAHTILKQFRTLALGAANARERKRIEKGLDLLVESTPYFRAAARRYLTCELKNALEGMERLVPMLREQNEILRKAKGKGRVYSPDAAR